MPKANEVRGEAALTLEGVDYILRPSFEAIDEFEAATGKSCFELYGLAAQDRMSQRDVATVATACIRAWGREVKDQVAAHLNEDKVKELIVEADGGLLVATRTLSIVLLLAATGGVTAKGEAKALASTETTAAPKGKTRAAA